MYVVCSYIVIVTNVAAFKTSHYFGSFTSNEIHAKNYFPLKLTSCSAVTLPEKLTVVEYYTLRSKLHERRSKRCFFQDKMYNFCTQGIKILTCELWFMKATFITY